MNNVSVSVRTPKTANSTHGSRITALKVISDPGHDFILRGESQCDKLMLLLNINWIEHERILGGETITRSITELSWDSMKKRI